MSGELVPYEERVGALSVIDIKAQVNLIQRVMREVMTKDEHYGVIPGTGTKPTLLKAGAEKLCLTFRLAPDYEIQETHEGAHIKITSKCILTHIPSGQRFGAGMGSCSTREAKYAYRTSARKCPSCEAEAIIQGRPEYGGGWICFKKKGGCGAKFDIDDETITKQPHGRSPNEDLADTYNTVLKMANKRSLVAAVLNATAASDIFTQDIEDMTDAAPQASTSETRGTRDGLSPEVSPPVVAAPSRTEQLKKLCTEAGHDMKALLAHAEVKTADEMSETDFASAVAMLGRKITNRKAELASPR